ncbi:D-Ala-D-Ala carboxypeptidase family metallohydrolase [Vibrio alginolyticus]
MSTSTRNAPKEVLVALAQTQNFNPKTDIKLNCSCGCGSNKVSQSALDQLQKVRDEFGKAMVVRSGFRCEKHPSEARKEKPGQHFNGVAFDIACNNGFDRLRLVEIARKHGARGIGIAKTFVHLDWREGLPVMWTY